MEIWTIGYEKAALGDVIATLKAVGVDLVLDVRERPQSRRAGFSKTMLSASLAEAGIDYRHLKALGTPAEGRAAHRSGDKARFWQIVDESLKTEAAREALGIVAEEATRRRACLLCYEADWRCCHRAAVLERFGSHLDAHHLLAQPIFF